VGPAAVRTIAGTTALHKELERKLALFKGAESAITFQSGFCANLAVIPAIVGEGDVVLSDELNHASIIDGCRLSRAKIIRYEHCNPADLQAKISDEKGACRMLIITDGVFSMEGDIAPLPEIVEIAEKFGAITMVDDAHGEGVLGRGGRGIVDHFNLHGKVDVEVGTLSKAFGVVGGYVAGSKRLTDYLATKRSSLPLFERRSCGWRSCLHCRGGHPDRFGFAGETTLGQYGILSGKDEGCGVSSWQHEDADYPGFHRGGKDRSGF